MDGIAIGAAIVVALCFGVPLIYGAVVAWLVTHPEERDAFGDCTNHTLTVRVLAQSTTPLPITGGSIAIALSAGLLLLATGTALRWWRRQALSR